MEKKVKAFRLIKSKKNKKYYSFEEKIINIKDINNFFKKNDKNKKNDKKK
ncbi:DUF4295 domain-containing protein [Candidatus Shikimatogenerans silvanidophilus]|nr:DUF4295 domain-containing protein [Candidatus Shikimatogenerans silvanidophilus]